ncbi:hypothetical protein HY230_05270 [Candidatus Acetothermia bacterium]|nr:hypothetical protein [Candidatus Acetothermia bacterium]
MDREPFDQRFCNTVQSLIGRHHTIYPTLPPQGIFFEELVQQAFKQCGWSHAEIVATSRNSPQHDLLVGNQRLSIKTETGKGTDNDSISITKLCTTEREPWDSETLIRHTLSHLSRYDRMLMLRAIWRERLIHYQLLEIPLEILRLISTLVTSTVGRRSGRRSLGGDVRAQDETIFHVHFDGADGKCQIRNL